jgi:hypothetical protein
MTKTFLRYVTIEILRIKSDISIRFITRRWKASLSGWIRKIRVVVII